MSRIILHIGAHKTATSYIQDVLTLNEDLLAQNGIIYPNIFPNGAHHVLTAPWRPEMVEQTGFTVERADAVYKSLVDEHAKSDRTVVLSAEPWSRIHKGVTNFAELAPRIEGFDEVVILYVMRHPWELLQSLYLQFTKDWHKPPQIESLLESAFNDEPIGGVTLDHQKVLDLVCEGFDESQVQFASYEKIKALPMGVLTPVMELCGLDALPEGFQPAPKSNVSTDPLATYVAHRMMPNGRPKPTAITRVRRAMDVHFGEKSKTTLLTEAEAVRLDAHFRSSADALYDRLSGHSPYITRQDLKFPDNLVQRDQIDLEFMFTLGRRLMTVLDNTEARAKAT